jgi:fructokinase
MMLVCGEALIDLIVRPDDPSGTSLSACTGGSPLNVATGIARLGTSAAFLGGISTDYFGDLIMQFAISEKIDTTLVKRTTRPTPLVAVATDTLGHPQNSPQRSKSLRWGHTRLRSSLSAPPF